MNIKTVHAVYFSPAGHTQAVVCRIARTLADTLQCPLTEDDFTLPDARRQVRTYEADELVVFGMPVYAGRVPNKALPFLQSLFQGNNTPAVCVVTFGNRSFDESLKELCSELHAHGFLPVAAGAFVCAHAMSGTLAADRPDAADEAKMKALAEGARGRLADISAAAHSADADTASGLCGGTDALSSFYAAEVGPYYRPLEESGEPANFLKAKPLTDTALCDNCGICARVCPMGSIDASDVTQTPGICIKCHACVRKCPQKAKSFADPSLKSHIRMLEQTYARRAESFILF